ncbi:MAG: 23S rRNA (pseudouridine(1915)-N(3))-methyltransferase RlmH [Gammaproteobacteria bacterium]|nr:23S rRNA (pseudouridine(1915)-N(3))-methyltransferase RlmH [Gammaproteobacteria bacterium]
MRVVLAAVVKRSPDWIREGFREYAKRLPPQLSLALSEVAPVARDGSQSVASSRRREAERLRAAIPKGACLIALDQNGCQWSTAELAAQLERWMQEGRDLALLVGGADGLDPALIESAEHVWSLSRLTLPHALVPVVLAEQLYRAWSLLNRHPYHRA